MYHIREAYREKGTKRITDYSYSLLTLEHKQWYYRETDEDDYKPTSNQYSPPFTMDDDDDNKLVENLVLATDLGISLDDIADTTPSIEMGGGNFGGGGSSGEW